MTDPGRDDDETTYEPMGWVLESMSIDEIRTAARLVHVAGTSQRQLLAAWRMNDRVLEPGFPAVLAALCLELGLERRRRGDATPICPVCKNQVASRRTGPSTDSQLADVPAPSPVP